jgi:cobalamin transport system permease protein
MPFLKSNKIFSLSIILVITGLLFFCLDLFLGSVNIPFKSILNILSFQGNEKESWEVIIINSRLPKALSAVLCGSALAVSGLKMQTLFRNPLAGPYILGISAGSGLGVAFFIMGLSFIGISVSSSPFLSNFGIITFSILGSTAVLMLLLAAIIRLKDIMTVLILGIMLGSIITALISIIQYFSNAPQLKSFIMWTMGDLSGISLYQIKFLFPIIMIGLIGSFLISKKLNLYLLGEEYASSLGLNIKQTRLITIILTAILAGTVTAYCGPIGFIGIVVPHIARLITGSSDHRKLIPTSILLGVNILLFADIISQLPGSESVLPINAITSLIGIPFIIWIIFKNKRISATN